MMRFILACTALLVGNLASAQIFECTDANGNKEFAQVCPPGTAQQKQIGDAATPSSAAPASNASPPKSLAEQEAEFRKRALEKKEAEAKAAKDQEDAKTAESNCADARAQLQALQNGDRMTKPGPNGERTYLEDADRPAEIEKAQNSVDSWRNKK